MGVQKTYWKHFRDARKPITPHSILRRWAPPAENNTEAYLRTVCRLSGLGGNENMPDPDVLASTLGIRTRWRASSRQ